MKLLAVFVMCFSLHFMEKHGLLSKQVLRGATIKVRTTISGVPSSKSVHKTGDDGDDDDDEDVT